VNERAARCFPSPWTVVEHAESWVQDARGQTVGWFYFRHNQETARQAKVLTRDEARRMAVNFARQLSPAADMPPHQVCAAVGQKRTHVRLYMRICNVGSQLS
jgi:hypothetical protein